MQKQLFINGRFLTQETTGVQVFAEEICKELEGVIDYTLLVPKNQQLINTSLNHKVKKIGNCKGYLWEQFSLPKFLKKQPNALLLNLCNLAPIGINKQIVTIHDLAFLKNKNWFSYKFQKAYNYIVPKIVDSSESIITVSKTVKEEIVTTFKVPNEKITVVYNKVSKNLVEAIPTPPKMKFEKFYLMVGSNNPRKNFEFVDTIFKQELKNEKLVVVGGSHISFKATDKTTTTPNISYLNNVSVEELKWLYQNTKGVICPSFYEGFGIPNIEAMCFDVPLLCSDIDVFKEVCGDYALYFKLEDKQDFITKINQLKKTKSGNKFEFYQSQDRVSLIQKLLIQ